MATRLRRLPGYPRCDPVVQRVRVVLSSRNVPETPERASVGGPEKLLRGLVVCGFCADRSAEREERAGRSIRETGRGGERQLDLNPLLPQGLLSSSPFGAEVALVSSRPSFSFTAPARRKPGSETWAQYVNFHSSRSPRSRASHWFQLRDRKSQRPISRSPGFQPTRRRGFWQRGKERPDGRVQACSRPADFRHAQAVPGRRALSKEICDPGGSEHTRSAGDALPTRRVRCPASRWCSERGIRRARGANR